MVKDYIWTSTASDNSNIFILSFFKMHYDMTRLLFAGIPFQIVMAEKDRKGKKQVSVWKIVSVTTVLQNVTIALGRLTKE